MDPRDKRENLESRQLRELKAREESGDKPRATPCRPHRDSPYPPKHASLHHRLLWCPFLFYFLFFEDCQFQANKRGKVKAPLIKERKSPKLEMQRLDGASSNPAPAGFPLCGA